MGNVSIRGQAPLMENTGYTLSVARIGDDGDRRIRPVELDGGETNTEFLRKVTAALVNGDVYLAKARGNPNTRWLEADDEDLRELQRTFIPYELEEKYLVDQFEPTCTTSFHEYFHGRHLQHNNGAVHLLVRTKPSHLARFHFCISKNVHFFKCFVLLVCLACIVTGVALFAYAEKTSETIYNDVGQLLAVTLSGCGILSTLLLCKK